VLTIFLSDLHIGLNVATNWYQKSVHQKYLKAILRYIQTNGSQIKDVVILGDWFDYWMYLPKEPLPVSLEEIFAANQDIFAPSGDGDFITCMDSIQGDLRFVNGNHDMTVSAKDINSHFRPLSTRGKQVVCEGSPENNSVYKAEGIYAEHGHRYILLSRPDNNQRNLFKPLPLDNFVCRTWADISLQYLQALGKENVAHLGIPSKPVIGSAPISLGCLLKSTFLKISFPEVILYSMVALATKGKESAHEYFFLMPDGSNISAAEASKMFPDISISRKNLPMLIAEISRSLTRRKKAFCRQGYRVVVMGHTHLPKIELYPDMKSFGKYTGIIINTGCLCPSIRQLNHGRHMSFAEVEQKDGRYYARLMKVDYPDTTISVIKEIKVSQVL
jgi:UDP-2,3-diacylglucosamine pyrophosphatase LpxH